MALFFKSSGELQCKSCGSNILSSRTVGTYAPSLKEEGVLVFTPVRQEIYCPICGKIVKTLDTMEKIKGRSGNYE